MHWLNSSWARRFNRRHGEVGHAHRGRYASTVIERDEHLLENGRDLPRNPVRAGACLHPLDWPWSSYAATLGTRAARNLARPERSARTLRRREVRRRALSRVRREPGLGALRLGERSSRRSSTGSRNSRPPASGTARSRPAPREPVDTRSSYSGADAPDVMPTISTPSSHASSISLSSSMSSRHAARARDLDEAVRVRRVARADHEQQVDLAEHLLHRPLPVGGRVADVLLLRRVDAPGSARRSAAIISCVSSTESVVCVT